MGFPLTDEQRFAVDTLTTNCIVPAGAGSGKTRVLVERYLKILEENKNHSNMLEKIVAITFTDKAAREMKERVRKGMIERREQAILNNNDLDATYWRDKLQKLERASISTIHSFCGKILREFPVEANVDPEFNILDQTEANWLLMDTIEKVLKTSLKQEKEKGLSFFYHWITNASFERAIQQFKQVYHQITNSGMTFSEIKNLTLQQFMLSPYQWIDPKDWNALVQAGDQLSQAESNNQRFINFQDNWPLIKEQLISVDKDKGIAQAISQMVELTQGRLGNNVSELRKHANELASKFKEKLEAIEYHSYEQEYVEAIFPLLEKINQQYLEEKAKVNGIDFDELQLRTIELLKTNSQVRQSIRQRTAYLMIDEFQDNNQIQKQLLFLILKNEEQIIPSGSLFVVGDPKQSIYRFRGANVHVFKEMEKEIIQMDGRIAPLQFNFRSNPKIIDFVNSFFKKVMSEDQYSPNYYKEAIAKKELQENDNQSPIEYIPIFHDKESEETLREREAFIIAKRINGLLKEGVHPKEITILFRSMSDIKVYEYALSQSNIPFYVVGGKGFYEKQEIHDLLHVLKFLLDPSNKIALAGILRSPMVSLSDDSLFYVMNDQEELLNEIEKWKIKQFWHWFNELRNNVGKMKVYEIVEFVVKQTNFDTIQFALPFGEQAVANIEKFIRLIKTSPVENPYSLYDLLKRVERLMEEAGSETEAAIESEFGNTVKLMTIHKSKGLEFPYVFVPDLSRAPVNDTALLRFDAMVGLTCKLPINGEWKNPIRWLYVDSIEKQLEREESVRVFYVAATRAEQKLIMSGKVEEAKSGIGLDQVLTLSTWNKWLDVVFRYSKINMETKIWEYILLNGEKDFITIWLEEQEDFLDQSFDTNDLQFSFLSQATEVISQEHFYLTEEEFSVSAIKRYQHCPRYYYYSDRKSFHFQLDWLQEENREELINERNSEVEIPILSASLKGTIVHQLLERLTLEKTRIKHWEEELTIIAHPLGVLEGDLQGEWEQFVKEVGQYIDAFSSSSFAKDSKELEVLTEYDFYLSLENGNIVGTIDRLEIYPDKTFSIIDYKTDKEIDLEKYQAQLYTYALAIQKLLKLKPKSGVLYFIRHNETTTLLFDEQVLNDWEQELEQLLLEMTMKKEVNEFPKDTTHCSFCIYQGICEKK